MPRMTGLQAARELSHRRPELRLLMLSMYDNEQFLFEALKAEATGSLHQSLTAELERRLPGRVQLLAPSERKTNGAPRTRSAVVKNGCSRLISCRDYRRGVRPAAMRALTPTTIGSDNRLSCRASQRVGPRPNCVTITAEPSPTSTLAPTSTG